MRARDEKGRYLRAADEICNFLELILMSFKIIVVGLILYLLFSYLEFSEMFVKFLIKKFLSTSCKITCPKEDNGGF